MSRMSISLTRLFTSKVLFIVFICYSQPSNQFQKLNDTGKYPKLIWTFYDTLNSTAVSIFVEENKKRIPSDWNLIFLTLDNVTAVIKESELPRTFYKLWPQLQADYLRVALVEKYGGFWMDLTTLIGNPSYLEYIRMEMIRTGSDFYAECKEECPLHWLETGFFYAPTSSVLMNAWRREMDLALRIGIKQYMYNADQYEIPLPRLCWFPYPKPNVYFLLSVAQQVALQRKVSRDTPLLVVRALDNMYRLQADGMYNTELVRKKILEEFRNPHYNISKLNFQFRQKIWPDNSPRPGSVSADSIYPLRISRNYYRCFITDLYLKQLSLRICMVCGSYYLISAVFRIVHSHSSNENQQKSYLFRR